MNIDSGEVVLHPLTLGEPNAAEEWGWAEGAKPGRNGAETLGHADRQVHVESEHNDELIASGLSVVFSEELDLGFFGSFTGKPELRHEGLDLGRGVRSWRQHTLFPRLALGQEVAGTACPRCRHGLLAVAPTSRTALYERPVSAVRTRFRMRRLSRVRPTDLQDTSSRPPITLVETNMSFSDSSEPVLDTEIPRVNDGARSVIPFRSLATHTVGGQAQ